MAIYIAIGSDHAGFNLKTRVKKYLKNRSLRYEDLGAYSRKPCDDYPYIAATVAGGVADGTYKRGVLICGTGIGMSIVANKVPGVRASLCNDLFSAKKSREHNDANVLVIGARIIGEELAKEIVKTWLATRFLGGRNARRVAKYKEIEEYVKGKDSIDKHRPLPLEGKRVIDLSQTLLPGKEEYRLKVKNRPVEAFLPEYSSPEGSWYIMSEVSMWSHVGTHLEAPYHYMKRGKDVSAVPVEKVMGEAVVLDFNHKRVNEPIERKELEELGKEIREGDIVILKTGFDRFYRTPKAHDRPYLTVEATQWLVEKKISCLATDASGFEVRGVAGQPDHELLFKNDIPVIEHLTNLDKLTAKRVFFIALPWKVCGLDASPVRAIAIEK